MKSGPTFAINYVPGNELLQSADLKRGGEQGDGENHVGRIALIEK
jgi:hypothetical protein